MKNKEVEEQLYQLTEEKNRAAKLHEESIKRIAEIEETTATNRALVTEYKEKNDLLTGMLAEYKTYKERVENLKGELEQERQAKRTAEEKLQDCLKEAASLKTALEDAKIRCVSDLERVQEKADLEKMKELLQVKADYQEKHEQAVATAQAAIGKLQEESSAKIKSLLDRIDHLQTPAKQKSHPVK
jgi:chromosome segregation ATPase